MPNGGNILEKKTRKEKMLGVGLLVEAAIRGDFTKKETFEQTPCIGEGWLSTNIHSPF